MTSLQIGGMGERQQTRRNNPSPSFPPPQPPTPTKKKRQGKIYLVSEPSRTVDWEGALADFFFAFFPTAEPGPRLVTEGNSGANIYMK